MPASIESGRVESRPRDPTRIAAWTILLALAALQGWANRFAVSPDGISYLDLSDAVVSGHWRELLNPYWSPLYPTIVGLLRVVLRPGPYWEVAALHLANFLFFAASLAAFEYFLAALGRRAAGWGRTELATSRGRAVAYALFGLMTLVMTPLSLTTPDLLVSVVVYLALGALVRLPIDERPIVPAMVLGAALAVGSLAKTFIIPWSVVCLVVALLVCLPRRQWRVVALSALCWAMVAGIWSIALSQHVGRVTYGDTGKLTYAWYVNMKVSPTSIEMPPATEDAAVDALLTGVAVMRLATGTNPIWYDPARWYAGVRPVRDVVQQLKVFRFLITDLAKSLAPILLLLLGIVAVRPTTARRDGVRRAWVVVVPSLLAIGAYSLILVATRYVVAFVVALTVAVCMSFDWPGRGEGAWETTRRRVIAVGALLLVLAGGRKYAASLAPLFASSGEPNATWAIAQRLRASGFEPGMRIALVGSPFDAYWVRTLHGQIVSVVPPERSADFWALPDGRREALTQAFAAAGADAVVVTVVPTDVARDPRWQARYPGGVRVLRGRVNPSETGR